MGDWPLVKIISGGQAGADLAGLRAGKALGYVTGGTMPHQFRAEDGLHPEYADLYGCVELDGGSYSERTRVNVIDSDGTIWFGDPTSPGGTLTLKCCRLFRKPKFLVSQSDLEYLEEDDYEIEIAQIRDWIVDNHIRVLNIAGSRESKHPGIGAEVEALLLEALKR